MIDVLETHAPHLNHGKPHSLWVVSMVQVVQVINQLYIKGTNTPKPMANSPACVFSPRAFFCLHHPHHLNHR